MIELSSSTLMLEAKAFHAKKRLGQHFLVSLEALEKIVSALDVKPDDTVVEIGPGIGFLTRLLSESGAETFAVELDREGVALLREMDLPGVTLIHGDFLQFDLGAFRFREKRRAAPLLEGRTGTYNEPPEKAPTEDTRIKVVGNVPYQITGPIIGHLLGELDKPSPWLARIEDIVMTVQLEVARRIVAEAGEDDYSKLSLLVSRYAKASLEMIVPKESFYPAPQVTSAIVRLTPHKHPVIQPRNARLMKQIVDAGFRQRRKMYRNSLSFLQLPPGAIDRIFANLNLDPQVRPERLSLQQFAMLADALDEYIKNNAQNSSTSSSEDQPDF